MILVKLWNSEYFSILWSGIDSFEWEKSYYSTSSIQWTEIWEPEDIITYEARPSRANMQPIVRSVWFAKMAKTLKVIAIDEEFAEQSILSTWFALIYGNPEKIDSEYLKYFFLSSDFNSQKDKLSTGTTQVAINQKGIEKIEMPIFDIDTQRLIVSEIEKQFSRLDKWLSSLLRIRENLKSYRASLLKSAVEWRLTAEWRAEHPDIEIADILIDLIRNSRREKWMEENPGKKYKEPEKIKGWVEVTELPKEWTWSRLEEITYFITDWKHWDCSNQEWSGYYFLSAKDVKNWKLQYENARQINYQEFKEVHNRTNLEPWDICIVNTWATVWKIALAQDNELTRKTTFQKSVATIKMLNKVTNWLYIKMYLESYTKRLLNLSKWSAINNLLLSQMRDILIPLPPLIEQIRIVEILEEKFSVIDSLESLVNENIKRAENLKQAILKKTFSGELVQESEN